MDWVKAVNFVKDAAIADRVSLNTQQLNDIIKAHATDDDGSEEKGGDGNNPKRPDNGTSPVNGKIQDQIDKKAA